MTTRCTLPHQCTGDMHPTLRRGQDMNYPGLLIGLLLLLVSAAAHSSDELLAVVEEEQQAFKDGDCDKVESMLAEDVTFYANSRKMTREQVGNFCRSIKRPFGAGRDPIEDTITPYLLTQIWAIRSEISGGTTRMSVSSTKW